jgi:hypothetical protein
MKELSHFSRVTDPARPQWGDVLVVPSEAGKKTKKLHVSCRTYGKMGMSVGTSNRANNRCRDVEETLGRDTGKARAYVITRATPDLYRDTRSFKFQTLLGNARVRDERPDVPKACYVSFMEIRAFGDDVSDLDFLRRYIDYATGDAAKQLCRAGATNALWFLAHNGGDGDEHGATIREAVQSNVSRGPRGELAHDYINHIDDLVPARSFCMTGQMDEKSANDFLESNCQMFTPGYQQRDKEIRVGGKFLPAMVSRGATLWRPDTAFRDAAAADAVSRLAAQYDAECDFLVKRAALFAEGLKRDVAEVKSQRAEMRRVVASLRKLVDRRVVSEYGKAVAQ